MRIALPLPPSINTYYSQNKWGYRFKTGEARAWEMEAGLELKSYQRFGKEKVELFIWYYFKNNQSDISNRTKILQDLLEKVGIIDNDNQIWVNCEYKNIDRKNPRVEIKIIKKAY